MPPCENRSTVSTRAPAPRAASIEPSVEPGVGHEQLDVVRELLGGDGGERLPEQAPAVQHRDGDGDHP